METIYDRVILGIDPGTRVMGYGILGIRGGSQATVIKLGVLKLDPKDDHTLRLKHIFEQTILLIEEFRPDELAIEAPFFGKNVQSMLKLGRAQGVAMAAGLTREVPIFEYSPKRIKQSITGKGSASKEQVAALLQSMFKMKETSKFLDATDGLAAAVCHYFQSKHMLVSNELSNQRQSKTTGATSAVKAGAPSKKRSKKKESWSSFISNHPGRVQR
jgi:crossover junction endodeoxyribonuclease RuvC